MAKIDRGHWEREPPSEAAGGGPSHSASHRQVAHTSNKRAPGWHRRACRVAPHARRRPRAKCGGGGRGAQPAGRLSKEHAARHELNTPRIRRALSRGTAGGAQGHAQGPVRPLRGTVTRGSSGRRSRGAAHAVGGAWHGADRREARLLETAVGAASWQRRRRLADSRAGPRCHAQGGCGAAPARGLLGGCRSRGLPACAD